MQVQDNVMHSLNAEIYDYAFYLSSKFVSIIAPNASLLQLVHDYCPPASPLSYVSRLAISTNHCLLDALYNIHKVDYHYDLFREHETKPHAGYMYLISVS